MASEHAVIDLGDDEHKPVDRSGTTQGNVASRQKTTLRLVAVFVVGVVLGGLGVGELRDSREQRERSAVVTLVALPASVNSGGSYALGSVQLNGQLTLINAGPTPITIRAVRAEGPGVQVRDVGQPRLVRPGGTGQIIVDLQFECSIAFQPEPLSVRFSVETDDKQVREVRYPVALVGSAWQEIALPMCEPHT
ncbi:hypothetical protein [Micromonospora sp. NBC_01638]|uniref:hypothetical protein n=1 Tax=Micromonospora sp. NBC_01638 TaxID=2975982 RepID=UPI003867F097|nr:hypothetical protein OG811_03460 [Micromonospora sp. NBC_01638]